MKLNWIWEAILIFFIGTFILRIGGRKSISQMTISQTIVMIGLGSLLIQPVAAVLILLIDCLLLKFIYFKLIKEFSF